MKNVFYISLLFILVACEDKYEVTHEYSRPYSISKEYPIQLDAREILVDIQIEAPVNPNEAFKIVSNEKYIFVGEKMKGVHVFEKSDESHTIPLCFIECKYIKAFDVVDNMLYCNNFVDLLVIDVTSPLQSKILHREKDYFNKYYSNSSFNFPILYNSSINDLVYILGYKQVVLTGIETETAMTPEPDFSEYDKLYGNMVLKEIPDTLQVDKPYVGIVNVEGNIFTLGDNCLMQCSYSSNGMKINQSTINIPNNFSVMPYDNLLYKDGMIFITGLIWGLIYLDYNNIFAQSHLYSINKVKDVVSIKQPKNSIVAISSYEHSDFIISGFGLKAYNSFATNGYISNATSLINVNDTVLALSNQSLVLYCLSSYYASNILFWSIKTVNQPLAITGTSMLRDGNKLIVANKQGLLLCDISDLENITLIK